VGRRWLRPGAAWSPGGSAEPVPEPAPWLAAEFGERVLSELAGALRGPSWLPRPVPARGSRSATLPLTRSQARTGCAEREEPPRLLGFHMWEGRVHGSALRVTSLAVTDAGTAGTAWR
jgi:hypothetical protein